MTIPSLDIDFYSDEVILDPHPVYKQMRTLGPVVYLPRNDLYALPRYKEVSEVLRQPMKFVNSRGVSPIPKVNDILIGSTLNSDPPEHDRTRAVTSEPLLPGALKSIEPRLQDAANGLIETLCARGKFDAVADLAQYLPVTIVAELVGLPQTTNSAQMLKWASATFNLFGTENARTIQAFEDLKDLRKFLQEYGRPEKLADGGWAKRIFEIGPERGISYETCAQLMRDYINPSLDTTISATGQIIKFLADHPDQWELIRNDASLIPNAVEDGSRYRLGILLDPNSRGGSTAIHTQFNNGQKIRIGHPRNNFQIQSNVSHTILFAGGIGITPMLSMAYAMEAAGVSWEMHYCGRTADRLAFTEELFNFGNKVQVHVDSGPKEQQLDINKVLTKAALDRHLYVCGPNGFMDFIVESAKNNRRSTDCVHLERFGAEVNTDGAPFTVVARKSGKSFEVQPGETISQKLDENGIDVQVSCQSGVYGTCLTRVVEGMPDHRDLVQTDLEKASNAKITVCCSRSKTKTLVLDV